MAQINLNELDRVEPPAYTVLSEGSLVKVVRMTEEYYLEQEVIPFEHQELHNEGLPEGDRRLSQPGVNGLQETTFQRVFEDGQEISNTIVKTTVLQPAVPEVVMIGSRSSFPSVGIPGKIAYLSAGNAWIIEDTTANRRLVVSSGDLDGRIFSLSPDGKYLLFSRFSQAENSINELWIASLEGEPPRMIDLGVYDVIHFAVFNPASNTIGYSTVEWRETAPGWQANNDLVELPIGPDNLPGSVYNVLDSSSGGIYGWWGTEYMWSPDGGRFLYSRPDGFGIYDVEENTHTSIWNITPYQTGGNWAWVPGAAWSPDGNIIYGVDYQNQTSTMLAGTDRFDLVAIPLNGGSPVRLGKNVGMFAYPVPSPLQMVKNFLETTSGTTLEQVSFSIAFLEAIFPEHSDTSWYRLAVIDRDGSNHKILFPKEGALGLDPQRVVWSPDPLSADGDFAIAFIHDGNVWLVSTGSGLVQQVTGDGLTSNIDWR